MIVEQYVICPTFDTGMIPYDLFVKWKNGLVCANDGVWIKIIDRHGDPVPEIEIDLEVNGILKRRIVYDGNVQDKTLCKVCVKTDAAGRAYVPIKIDSCARVQYSGCVVTTKGKEAFSGEFDCNAWRVRIGSRETYYSRWGQFSCPTDWKKRWWWRDGSARCYRCDKVADFQKLVNGMGVWTMDGACRYCGKYLARKSAKVIELELRKSRVTWPSTKEEYVAFNALTGLPVKKIEEICGKCPQVDGSKQLVIRLDGELDCR
jgi:hypothetical protein